MNETKNISGEHSSPLRLIRILLRIILFIATFFMLDMFYTIIYPDRYYIFEVNYIFILLYILTAAAITYITVKLNDFFIHKVKFRSDLFIKLIIFIGMIIYFGRFTILGSWTMAQSYGDWAYPYIEFSLGELLMLYMFVYICIMIDYFCIRSILRHIPAYLNWE